MVPNDNKKKNFCLVKECMQICCVRMHLSIHNLRHVSHTFIYLFILIRRFIKTESDKVKSNYLVCGKELMKTQKENT